MHFHRVRALPRSEYRTRAEQGVRNHQDKGELVEQRRTHGVLVYAEREPVGWCQYGRRDELPRIDHLRRFRDLAGDDVDWRITCFVVRKEHRRRGAAAAALKGALDAMRKRGGGLVEGYPVVVDSTSRRTRLPAGNHFGTVSMFRKQGFKTVGAPGSTHVLMRRVV
jgi:GNAT superfamily N-acetyltransferase